MSEEKKNVVVEEEVENTDAGVYVFKRKTKIEGEVVEEISYDFSTITGKTMRKVRTELGKRAYVVSVPELDQVFQAALFAEASGISLDAVEAFSGIDYLNVANIARDFLNGED